MLTSSSDSWKHSSASPSLAQISTMACLAKAVIACCTTRIARFTSTSFILST
jgi:hypothetical protein